MGRHRVRILMQLNSLRPVWRRKFVHTTDSKHGLAVSPNVLDRQFEQALPNRVWVSAITYIRTKSGWLYLAAVLDLHSRKIVGWAMANAMPAALVCAALQMAIVQRNPAPGLIVHSDRGTQYTSSEHQALLTKYGLVSSMSRKGNCWDNAVMERFFLNLKAERVWQKNYANHSEAMNDIADYIVGFYKSIRLHSKLGNLSPNALERESTSKKNYQTVRNHLTTTGCYRDTPALDKQLVVAWKVSPASGADCVKPTVASRRAQAVLPRGQRTAPAATARAFRNSIS